MSDQSPAAALGIACRLWEQALEVTLSGDLTARTGERLLKKLAGAPWRRATTVVVDLAGVTTCDGVGARALLDLNVAVMLRTASMRITGTTPAIEASLVAAGGQWMLRGDRTAPPLGAAE